MRKILAALLMTAALAMVPVTTAAPAFADTTVCVEGTSNPPYWDGVCVWVPVSVIGCDQLPPNQVCKSL